MTTVRERTRSVPTGAKIVAAILVFFAFVEFRSSALPALAATDVDEFWQATINATFSLIVIAGLLQLKGWAWWFALFTVIGRLVQTVVGLVVLTHPEWSAMVGDVRGAMVEVSTRGALALLALYFLAESGTRAAYRD